MRTLKVAISILVTAALTYALNSQLKISGQTLPPLGKLLSPFHGFWQNAENERLNAPEELVIEGLKQPVKIYFDDLLIPHIYAKNDHDLFLAQGYVTAYHRLWQMEFQLYSTAGRISELIGEQALDYDRKKRRSGMAKGAKMSEELMRKEEPEYFSMIEAYTKGVNAYINSLDYKDYPIEYKLLDYSPEEWTTYNTFLLTRELASQLSLDERDLEHTNALALWGPEIFEKLYPERRPDIDPIIPAGTTWDFEPIQVEMPSETTVSAMTKGQVSRPDPKFGSNNFVVNGAKTSSGNVLLANEPDLSLNLPSIWYVVHLNSPNFNVMGSSIPGGPAVILGFNDHIAWGFTNAKRDLVDWYKIEFRDSARNEYRYDNKWLKTEKKVEEIKIRGGRTFYDTIVYTHHGPVSYDQFFDADEERINMAMRWTAHDPSKDTKSLFMINQATNYDEYVDAFSYWTGPPQNMIYGDVEGDIALWVNGKFPVKWEGQGKFVLDGSNALHDWQAYMPREHLYQIKNPSQNFLSSANQHPGDGTYPYYDYDYNFENYRNRRINDRLRVMTNIRPSDLMKLQNDNFNYMASESLPFMLRALDSVDLSTEELEVVNQLREWDYFNEPEKVEPSLYQAWYNHFYDLTWDEFDDQELSLYRPHNHITVRLMNTDSTFEFFDVAATDHVEQAGDIAIMSFKLAQETLNDWRAENGDDLSWYKFKNTTVSHLLGDVIPAFNVSQVKIGGNHGIVNAASRRVGPSWRFVVELGPEGVSAWGIYPGGQTGNPGNPAFTELIDRWATGKYEPMIFSEDVSSEERIIFTQTLNSAE